MFIPRGNAVHENLATSYLLVDKLADDLCNEGFSGVIEVTLRDTEAFVVIRQGKLAAVIERRGEAWEQTTLERLGDRSRLERGIVSVHAYDAPTADAVAGRLRARALYVSLSTDFTDPSKVLSKLANERDREWFIEINSTSGHAALIHLRDGYCLVIGANGEAVEESDPALAANPDISRLLDECKRVGGAFDVLFTYSAQSGTLETSQKAAPSLVPTQSSDALTSSASTVGAQTGEPPVADGEALTEVKRLMGEIAATIEEAGRAVGPHESFAMSLRAAQLQIADSYAFLDPFAGEFEYMGGEIVLVGQLKIEELIAGVSEALSLAVANLARSTAYSERFRAYVSEDLQRLLASKRSEFESFSLDQVIKQLIDVVSEVEPVRESAFQYREQ